MRVLVACEESQRVSIAFRERGHEAYSCDIQEPSGGHPEWHIMQDVLPLINGNCTFRTMDEMEHRIDGKWDLLIAHPPCTHLASSGARHFPTKRLDGRQKAAIEFFCQFLYADCERIAVENPVGIISGDYCRKNFPDLAEKYGLPRKPSQILQPYNFGHPVSKKTCLWLVGLPKLSETDVVVCEWRMSGGKRYSGAALYAVDETGKAISWNDPRTAKERSKTFPGIARAMAEQWG